MQGISNTMLSQTLKELERDGLVLRKEYLQVPVRVEYELSEASEKLRLFLLDIYKWQMGLQGGGKEKQHRLRTDEAYSRFHAR